jgi:hypothetical protein
MVAARQLRIWPIYLIALAVPSLALTLDRQ